MSRSVLVCDDDRLFVLWLSRLLTEWGWIVQSATNVDDAVSALQQSRPDVLILDLYIGNQTASELLAQIKGLPDIQSLPIFVISAASPEEVRMDIGNSELTVLTKPIDHARLITVLDSAVPPAHVSKTKSLSFLILDNGGIQAKMLGRMLEEAGVFVLVAPNIENAKILVRNVRPDGVLFECDGSAHDVESLSEYCVTNQLHLPPIIVLSSVINQELVERLLRAGVVDILLKPVSTVRLHDAIRRIGGGAQRDMIGRTQGRKTIMVVEDFTITAKLFERMLTHEGFQVYVVRSAEMAFEMIRRVRPDLMLLDLNLPGMSGFDLLHMLNASGQAVPTIVVTGERDQRKLRDLRKLGALRFFNKPIASDELASYVNGYFSDSILDSQANADYDVLLALADEVAGNVLANALESNGIKSKVIVDGYQAVHEILSKPQVVVLDVVISGLDGTEVMRRGRGAFRFY